MVETIRRSPECMKWILLEHKGSESWQNKSIDISLGSIQTISFHWNNVCAEYVSRSYQENKFLCRDTAYDIDLQQGRIQIFSNKGGGARKNSNGRWFGAHNKVKGGSDLTQKCWKKKFLQFFIFQISLISCLFQFSLVILLLTSSTKQ